MSGKNNENQEAAQATSLPPAGEKNRGWLIVGVLMALVISVSLAVVVHWDLLHMDAISELPAEDPSATGYMWCFDSAAIDATGILTIDGWFLKGDTAYYPNVAVVLMDEDNHAYSMKTKSTWRTDLSTYINNGNDYSHGGIHAVTKLKEPEKAYSIYFLVTREDKTQSLIFSHKAVQANSNATTGAIIRSSNISETPAAEIVKIDAPSALAAGEQGTIEVTVKNTGTDSWQACDDIKLCLWENGTDRGLRMYLPSEKTVLPGESTVFIYDSYCMPSGENITLEAQMLQEGIVYFGERTPVIIVNSANAEG